MKKRFRGFRLWGIWLFLVFAPALSWAQTSSVSVEITVNAIFQMTLDRDAIAYTVDPGQNQAQTVTVTVESNLRNVAWRVEMACDNRGSGPCLQDTTTGETLGGYNVFTHSTTASWGNPTTGGQVSPSGSVLWRSPADGHTGGGAQQATTTYTLRTPADASAGYYTTTLFYTLVQL